MHLRPIASLLHSAYPFHLQLVSFHHLALSVFCYGHYFWSHFGFNGRLMSKPNDPFSVYFLSLWLLKYICYSLRVYYKVLINLLAICKFSDILIHL